MQQFAFRNWVNLGVTRRSPNKPQLFLLPGYDSALPALTVLWCPP
jgi:hypothetical protein